MTHRRPILSALLGLLMSGCQDAAPSDADGDTSAPDTDSALPETDPSIFTTGICLEGWCFEQPLPFGPRLPWPRGFWAASPDEAWAVVDKTLQHGKENRWTVVGGEPESDHPATRFAVPLDGTARDNVVVATTDGAMHFDGTRWTNMADCPKPASIWVAGPDDVWLAAIAPEVGHPQHTTLYRWDGASCTAFQTFEFAEEAKLEGSDPDHGWLALRSRAEPPPSMVEGQLLRWDGIAWTHVLDLDSFTDLVAVSADLAWLIDWTALRRWDGAQWAETDLEHVGQLWFTSETEGWATTGFGAAPARSGSVLRWDGATWTTVRTESNYPVYLYGAGPDSLLATLENGRGARWDGETWTPTIPSDAPLDLLDIAVGPTGEAWAVSADGLLRRSNGHWHLVDPEGGTIVWSGAEGEALVGEGSGVRRWANGWKPISLPREAQGLVVGIWGATPELVFVATSSSLSKWTGSGWSWTRPAPAEIGALRAVHGSGADDVWVLGALGLARVDGEGWELIDMPNCPTSYRPFIGEHHDLWVEAPGRPVAVGYGTYDGGDVVYDGMSVVRHGEEGLTCAIISGAYGEPRVAACDGEVRVLSGGQVGPVNGWLFHGTWLGASPNAITCAPGRGFWVAGSGGTIAHRPPAAR